MPTRILTIVYRAVALATLVVFLAAVGAPAHSATKRAVPAATKPRVELSLQIAKDKWDKWGPICSGQRISIRRGAMRSWNALARADYRSLAAGQKGGSRAFGDCRITFRKGYISTPAFCSTMVHEVGHLAGYRAPRGQAYRGDPLHSSNRRSIMYPIQTFIWPACKP